MIVHLPRRRKHFPLLDPIPGIERVEKTEYTWITVSHTLTFQMSALVTKCSGSFYARKSIRIRAHGLNGNALWDITRATLVSQHQYACPAWGIS